MMFLHWNESFHVRPHCWMFRSQIKDVMLLLPGQGGHRELLMHCYVASETMPRSKGPVRLMRKSQFMVSMLYALMSMGLMKWITGFSPLLFKNLEEGR